MVFIFFCSGGVVCGFLTRGQNLRSPWIHKALEFGEDSKINHDATDRRDILTIRRLIKKVQQDLIRILTLNVKKLHFSIPACCPFPFHFW